MDVRMPPEPRTNATAEELSVWANDLYQWASDLYQWLQYPHFHQMRLVPRSDAPTDTSAGVKYYDSDDNKEKTHNGTAWQDTY